VVDPEARRGRHGDWYDGYLVDIFEDADSEIVTQVNVMPANGEEAADAIALLIQEEEAHGNDVDTVSIDGAGFNGPVLRELEDPEGLNVDVIVPPKAESTHGLFTPDDFAEDTEQGVVTCPAGETSRYRQRDAKQRTTIHRFPADVCESCALLKACMENAPKKFGRSVRKNDYQEEYARVRQKATTDKYAEVRRKHPKVERKLGEILNCHGGRRARYWGVEKVAVQELLATMATNVKRIVRLVCAPTLQLEPQA
jgi:hypothetical protein